MLMPQKPTGPSEHGMIKPKKRTRTDRSAVKAETPAPAEKPAKKPRVSAPKAEPAVEATSESAPKRERRSRRKPKVMPKTEIDPAQASAPKPVEERDETPAPRSRKRPTRTHAPESETHTPEDAPIESRDVAPADNASSDDDGEGKPRRRRRRGGRGRKRNDNAEQAEQTAESGERDADASDERPARERDERPEPVGEDDEDQPKRSRRRRRGGRGRRGGEERSEGGRSEDSRDSDERAPREVRTSRTERAEREESDAPKSRGERSRARLSDEPVVFDADAEYDPDVFADHTYDEMEIRGSVLKGIHACGFNRPTHIQDRLIPVALTGKDVIGQAKTGTGKTAAFSIPALCLAERGVAFQTVILAPTRELAIQITREIEELGRATPIKACAVYGGQPIPVQKKKLEQNPEIIVATPGRLMDMYEHNNIHFRNVKQVILDEVDRMLDIGFRDDIKKILRNVKTDHQTIFVSATISDEIETLARSFMTDPERLTLTAGALTVQLVDQQYVPCENWYKRRLLRHLLTHEEPALTVVFCRTKATVDRVAQYLCDKRIDTLAIHGDMPQGKRNSVMEKLRGGKLSVLVASDLAARGLDVDDITHVINYDVPEDPEVYVHRIGRTARAGRRGHAWTFVLPDQGDLLTQIEHLTNVEITRLEYDDFDPGEPPADIRAERKKKVQSKERAEKMVSRLAGPNVPKAAANANDPRFPGGVVPTKLPPKMVRGKVNTTRGMKQMRAAELKDKKVEE